MRETVTPGAADGPRHARLVARSLLAGSLLAGSVLAGSLVACTGRTADDPASGPATPIPGAATGPASPAAPAAPSAPGTTEPLVLAVHPSRAPVRLTLRLARRVADGRVASWRRLTGESAPLRVVTEPRRRLDPGTVAVLPASEVTAGMAPVVVDGVDPLRRPGAYPWQVPGPAPGPVRTVLVGGDVMLGRGVAATHPGGAGAVLSPLARHLRSADLTVVNLESTLSTAGPPRQGDDSFAAPASTPAALARLGVDAVSLANNHTGDFGPRALRETLDTLAGGPLTSFGAGRDLRAASRPTVLDADGLRVGLLAFNAIGETPAAGRRSPGALSLRMPPRTGPLDAHGLALISRLVRRLDRRADVVVVMPHWGDQYTHVAVPAQRLVARRLAAAGADLVVGGHPHWVQGLELPGGTVVAHSLGNLVFDMDFMEQTMEGVTLTATFWGRELKEVRLTAYRLDDRFRPRLVGGAARRAVLDDVWRHSTGPFAP